MNASPPTTLVDGISSGTVPVDDRGLAYGDGLFETMRAVAGRVRFLERHFDRLIAGCDRLGIARPDRRAIESDITALTDGHDDALIKLVITRGSGGRGYRPPTGAPGRRVVARHPLPTFPDPWYADGIALRWCDTRLAHQPALAGIKHLNRLEQVLARAEWEDDARWQEGLMCDADGLVIEATRSNVFIVRGGEIVTPVLDRCGVAGIIRGLVIEGFGAVTERFTPEAVRSADELFVCNSVIGVWPVRAIDDVVHDAPGPVTQRVIEWLASRDD